MNDVTLVIDRTFDCDAQTLFDMWTKPEHLANWWAPKGFTTEILNYDFKEGGVFHYAQNNQEGQRQIGLFKYTEIDAPHKLTFISGFSNEAGEFVKPDFHPDFPTVLHNVIQISEQDGKALLHTEGRPENGTEAENAFFKAMHDNMREGFSGTYEHLDQYLQTLK